MFYFGDNVKTLEINGVKIGGQPGEYPTVLFGSVFHSEEDIEDAKKSIQDQNMISDETGNPGLIDVIIRKTKEISSRLDFILDFIDGPICLDLPFGELEFKKELFNYIKETGCADRIIYNSVNAATSKTEFEHLSRHEITSAILLANDMSDPTTDGSLYLLEHGGENSLGLLERTIEAGIENVLIDPGSLPFDFNNSSGEVFRSLFVIKQEIGYPVGCGAINLVESWSWFKDARKKHLVADIHWQRSVTAVNSIAQLMGADFLLYGPIEDSRGAFVVTAMIDKILSEGMTYFGIESENSNHPRFKV